MEWNRAAGPTQPANQPAANHSGATNTKAKRSIMEMRIASTGLVFCIAVLLIALVGYVVVSKSNSGASDKVDKTKMQAVFLNGGQVYFGKITSLNDKFMQVSNIYYLRVNQQVQPDGSASTSSNQDISLVKLGCELHGPQDSMVINQQQIIFWENLKADGQVAKAVDQYVKANPNGQKCDTTASTGATTGTGTGTTTGTQNGTTTGTGTGTTTGTGTPSTTKKP